jgi:hypothetical protein
MIPDLELEVEMYLKGNPPLDSTVWVVSTGVDLPQLEAHFRA